ncbi:unnamed protein product [Arctia plantaginis]|uniref:Lipase n=1 Tax=Arctia plantaginis TaxID=874455 RepID=A0A8S1BS73_ARCPL|nr:unnamed protein product [Arctia plantaginis]
MLSVYFVVFASCATLATTRNVLLDETVVKLNGSARFAARYSNNIEEDARLNVPELITKYGYPVEVHHVTTEDGYILELHRIPYGRDKSNVPNKNKPIVILMHGLLCSSAVWVLTGPGAGFGYILAEEGYDVWMGNFRGNRYSRRHVTLNPDSIFNIDFWKFSWDEHGNYDLPAIIDYALAHTGKDKLHYIGHSMGTTSFFTMASLRPQYNEKIISMQALAPVAYMAHNSNPLLEAIAPFSNNIESIADIVGHGEFLPSSQVFTWAGEVLCRDKAMFQSMCSNILFLIGGWDEAQHNATIMPVITGHVPAGSSIRQLAHYGQSISGKEFLRYNQGNIVENLKAYGSFSPPAYDLSKITAPVYLHYGDNDPLAAVADVQRLFGELGKPMGMLRVPLAGFTHIDFMWAIDVKKLLYDTVISLLQ